MNTTEQLIFDQHMKNIDCRYEDFARECMQMQTPEGLSGATSNRTCQIQVK